MEELIVRLRIEEDTRKSERRNGGPSMEAKANMAESSSKKNMKRKHSNFAPKKNENNQKNKKFKGSPSTVANLDIVQLTIASLKSKMTIASLKSKMTMHMLLKLKICLKVFKKCTYLM